MGQCVLTSFSALQGQEHLWYLDSGCSRHMTGSKSLMEDYVKKTGPAVTYGDNGKGFTKGYGNIKCNNVVFQNVSYVKALKHNLISISQLCDADYEVHFTKKEGRVVNTNKNIVLSASLKVKQLRSDHGTEFRNSTLEVFCDHKGIGQNFSGPRTPQQNGVAERRNRTLIEAGRTLMIHAGLPMSFWAEAVNTACFTQNRSLIHRIHKKTPYEMLKDRKPDASFFHLLSCPFDEAPSAGDKTNSSDSIIPVPCSLNQDIAATSADNSLGADETLEAEDTPETDNVSVSNSPESSSVIEHRDHPVDRIIGNIHDGVRTRSSVLNNSCMYVNFVSMILPNKVHTALQDAD
uniref:Integrase catalytic domain-containing protein n=1 Tax=Lactuca sativa TaxID=4236 RepID=A0A9R1XRN3_LACSA|nr:hypothetical protein LSAT_V11C300102190 [Lactuca sativa]